MPENEARAHFSAVDAAVPTVTTAPSTGPSALVIEMVVVMASGGARERADYDVGHRHQFIEGRNRHGDTVLGQPLFGMSAAIGGDADEGETGGAAMKRARHRQADRAEPDNRGLEDHVSCWRMKARHTGAMRAPWKSEVIG